jgi:hypothetical protein
VILAQALIHCTSGPDEFILSGNAPQPMLVIIEEVLGACFAMKTKFHEAVLPRPGLRKVEDVLNAPLHLVISSIRMKSATLNTQRTFYRCNSSKNLSGNYFCGVCGCAAAHTTKKFQFSDRY